MLLPIRCYSCNKVLGNKSDALHIFLQQYQEQQQDDNKKDGGKDAQDVEDVHSSLSSSTEILSEEGHHHSLFQIFFKTHNIKRYCCKKIIMSHVDIFDISQVKIQYPNNIKIKKGVEIKKICIAK